MQTQEGVVGLLVSDGGRALEGSRGSRQEHGTVGNGWRFTRGAEDEILP